MGTWLPEPVDMSCDPEIYAERGEAVRLAILILLEKLSPTERATYILHEVFDYSYPQIADILQMKEANTRQLVSRARKHIADGRRTPVSLSEQRRLLEAFITAARKGELAALETLLAQDVLSCPAVGWYAPLGSRFQPAKASQFHFRRRVTFFEGGESASEVTADFAAEA